MYVCSHISKATRPNVLHILPVAVARSASNDSAICYIHLFFVDDVIFSYNRANLPYSKMTCMFHPVHHVAALGAKSTFSDSILHKY